MNKKEINKTIAEFMGIEIRTSDYLFMWFTDSDNMPRKEKLYTDSLDALVPVWEKLELRTFRSSWGYKDRSVVSSYLRPDGFEDGIGTEPLETIQHAAALATAKAILELGDSNE